METKTERKQPTPPRKRRRSKKRRIAWVAGLAGAALLALSAAAVWIFVQGKLDLIHYSDGRVTPAPEELPLAEEDIDVSGLEPVEDNAVPEGDVHSRQEVLNVMLLGTDYRSGPSDPGRADAILILSLDFRDDSARLVSLERGMGMPILSGTYAGSWDWITHLCHYGGPELVMESVRECFKLDVERYIKVDILAFIQVIDALGGVDVELTDAEAWALNNRYGEDGDTPGVAAVMYQGINHLSGYDALRLCRLRQIDSDWVRVQRQRRVLQACADQIRNADLATLNQLADTILPMVETNFTRTEILSLLGRAPGFLGVEFQQMTIPAEGTYGGMTVMGGQSAFAADFTENARILQEFLYGSDTPEG